MTAQEVVKELLSGVTHILHAEKEVLELEDRRRELILELQIAESNLILQEGGPINGKNAEIRAAQLLAETAPERIVINEFEREIARKKCQLNGYQNLFKVNQGIIALLASRPDITKL